VGLFDAWGSLQGCVGAPMEVAAARALEALLEKGVLEVIRHERVPD